MKCVNVNCQNWKKDEDFLKSEECFGYMDKTPCTEEERKQKGCTEWCGLPFC